MSCVLLPRDGPVLIVPKSVIDRWSTIAMCVEELKFEATVLPLSGEEAQVWLDLDQRMESRFTVDMPNHEEVTTRGKLIPPPLDPVTVKKVVNYLAPVTECWREHYVPRMDDVTSDNDYKELGALMTYHVNVSDGVYENMLNGANDFSPTEEGGLSKCNTLRAVVYCDWMRNHCAPLSFFDINWRAISRLQLHESFFGFMGGSMNEEGNVEHALLAALGGHYVDYVWRRTANDMVLSKLLFHEDETVVRHVWYYLLEYLVRRTEPLDENWAVVVGLTEDDEPCNAVAQLTQKITQGKVPVSERAHRLLVAAKRRYYDVLLTGLSNRIVRL